MMTDWKMKIFNATFLILIPLFTWSQFSVNQYLKEGSTAYDRGNYVGAMLHLGKAWKHKDNISPEYIFQYAESAYRTHSLAEAEKGFRAYIDKGDTDKSAFALHRLGQTLMQGGKYNEVVTIMDQYLSEFEGDDPDQTAEAVFLRSSANWASEQILDNEDIDVVHASELVNSPMSEHSPFIDGEDLIFASLRYPIRKDKLKRFVSKISRFDGEKTTLLASSGAFNNDSVLTSNFVLSPDRSVLFYTLCSHIEDYDIKCKIYTSTFDGEAPGLPRALPELINKKGFTTTQPAVQFNKDGSGVLYFVSDAEGGQGGLDIWSSTFDSTMLFRQPENLKNINTAKDDITPFVHMPTSTLYFSSEGHMGFGGFDIFATSLVKSGIPENLGAEINSPSNDIFYVLDSIGSTGYLSSNRPGSMYLETQYETCCYDIYKVNNSAGIIELKILTFDKHTLDPLEGVILDVVDDISRDTIYSQLSFSSAHTFDVFPGRHYTIFANKEEFIPTQISYSHNASLRGRTQEERKVYLSSSTLELEILDLENSQPLNGTIAVLQNLTDETEESYTNPTGHLYSIPIAPDKEYRIIVSKDGYIEASDIFSTANLEKRIEKILYLSKLTVKEVTMKEMIPLSLYFDNDQPDRKTLDTVSSKLYTETYDVYYAKKTRFKNIYSRLFRGTGKNEAEQRIESFFDSRLKAGFDKITATKNLLLEVLETGRQVNLYFRGYASPVSVDEYNYALGKRRVDSVRKEFMEWRNGIFMEYIRSGQLILTERSFGELTAPVGISDDVNNPAQSIFSPEASLERRVEIDEIQFKVNNN